MMEQPWGEYFITLVYYYLLIAHVHLFPRISHLAPFILDDLDRNSKKGLLHDLL